MYSMYDKKQRFFSKSNTKINTLLHPSKTQNKWMGPYLLVYQPPIIEVVSMMKVYFNLCYNCDFTATVSVYTYLYSERTFKKGI